MLLAIEIWEGNLKLLLSAHYHLAWLNQADSGKLKLMSTWPNPSARVDGTPCINLQHKQVWSSWSAATSTSPWWGSCSVAGSRPTSTSSSSASRPWTFSGSFHILHPKYFEIFWPHNSVCQIFHTGTVCSLICIVFYPHPLLWKSYMEASSAPPWSLRTCCASLCPLVGMQRTSSAAQSSVWWWIFWALLAHFTEQLDHWDLLE